jgi:hypothetical protein
VPASWRHAWKGKSPDVTIAFGTLILGGIFAAIAYYWTGQYKVPGTIDLLVGESRVTRRVIGRLHAKEPSDQAIIIDEFVVNAPASGLLGQTRPYPSNGGWYTRLILFDQKKLRIWDVPLSSRDDPKVTVAVRKAIQNKDVEAWTLDRVLDRIEDAAFVSAVSSLVDVEQSFVSLGSVEICRNNFSSPSAFGPPTIVEPLPEPLQATKTGREYIDLLRTFEEKIKPPAKHQK